MPACVLAVRRKGGFLDVCGAGGASSLSRSILLLLLVLVLLLLLAEGGIGLRFFAIIAVLGMWVRRAKVFTGNVDDLEVQV